MSDEPTEEEFDTVAAWTADAVEELGHDHALPAACRGSGSPDALRWLADRMRLGPDARLLDSGAGVGGPAQFVQQSHEVAPTLVDPMLGACRAAARLFDHRAVVGDGAALPVGDGSFQAAWSLGVLCTVEDKASQLAELRRVVVQGGAVGLLVFVRTVEELEDPPEGNWFVDDEELNGLVQSVGLDVTDGTWVADLDPAPQDWKDAVGAVDEVIERAHGRSEAYRSARRNQQRMIELLDDGSVAGRLLVCRARRG